MLVAFARVGVPLHIASMLLAHGYHCCARRAFYGVVVLQSSKALEREKHTVHYYLFVVDDY